MTTTINQTIIIPIDEPEYVQQIKSRTVFRQRLDKLIIEYPELFPQTIGKGYSFCGWSKSNKKIKIARRIIRLEESESSIKDYLIHPCFIMPYLRGKTAWVSQGLLLRKYNTPYHAIATIFQNDAMYWYRAELSLSRFNIVGTTVKFLANMPQNILVDEHHSRLKGKKVYICTTVGSDCFLGASASDSVRYEDLREAYGVFKQEIKKLCSLYEPYTINIDGFPATKKAVRALFPDSTIILCFLHAYLKIKACGTKAYDEYFEIVSNKVWLIYATEDKRSFAQQIRRLSEWTEDFIPDSAFKTAILKLCKKKSFFEALRLFTMSKNIKYAR